MPKTKAKSRLGVKAKSRLGTSIRTKAKATEKLIRLPPPPSPEFINVKRVHEIRLRFNFYKQRINAIDSTFGQTNNLDSRGVNPSLKKTRRLQVKLDTGPSIVREQSAHGAVENAEVDQRISDLKHFGDGRTSSSIYYCDQMCSYILVFRLFEDAWE